MPFDIAGARRAGYSEEEIQAYHRRKMALGAARMLDPSSATGKEQYGYTWPSDSPQAVPSPAGGIPQPSGIPQPTGISAPTGIPSPIGIPPPAGVPPSAVLVQPSEQNLRQMMAERMGAAMRPIRPEESELFYRSLADLVRKKK
jgi:hypothetical protein